MGVFEKINTSGSPSNGGGVFDRLNTTERNKNIALNQENRQKFGPINDNLMQSPTMQRINSIPVSEPEPQLSNEEMFRNEPSRKIPIIGPALKLLDSLSSNKAVKKIGEVGRALYTPGGTAANIAGFTGAVGRKAFEVAPKIAGSLAGSTAGRIAQTALKETAVGAPLNVGMYQAQGGDNDTEALRQAGIGAAFGGALGGLGGSARELSKGTKLGNAISGFFNKDKSSSVDKPQETLALPPASEESLAAFNKRNGNVLPPNTEPILGRGDIHTPEPLGLPQGDYVKPTRLKVSNNEDAFNSIVPRLFTQATERMTPPLENSNELAKWVQGHLNTAGFDISLNEVRGLKYEDLRQLAEEMRPKLNTADVVRKTAQDMGYGDVFDLTTPTMKERIAKDLQSYVYGVPAKRVNIIQPKFNVQHVADAAMPETKIGFNKDKAVPEVQVVGAEPAIVKPVTPDPMAPIDSEIPIPPVRPGSPNKRFTPKQILADDQIERGFVTTLRESEKPPQEFKDKLKAAYTPITNEATVHAANKRLDTDLEAAASYVLSKSQFNPEKVATAHRLIDEFTKAGNHQRAVDIAEKIAEEGTKAGQSIQAFSIYNRLSKEGILIHAQRIAAKTNEALPLGAKEVKVTTDMAARITDLAETTKTMSGVKDLSNDVMDILDRAKTGEKLNADDTDMLRKFVNDSKQFIEEVKPKAEKPPKPPQAPKDKRVRDNVISFLDAQEAAAKERLRARGIRVSSTPLDIWADYAIIGAAKMARGSIKFADWSEQMVKDLGESVKPHLQNLYDRARETFEQSSKKVTTQTISEAEKITERVINGKNLAPAEADSLRSLAQKVSALSGEEKRVASQDLQAILQELDRSGILKKISSIQTIGQLLNPKTQVRNALGNELFYRLERLNKLIATPIDVARSKLTGGARSVTFRTNNQGEYWENFMQGLIAGWKGVNINGLQTQYDLAGQTFKSKYNPLTYMEKALGASLRSFDNAAYSRAYNNTLGEMATLRAINEGKGASKELIQKYIREADDNVMQIADQYGKYATFQDNNLISVGLQKLKRGMNLGKDFGMGDLVLKYPKTPGALLSRALEYSPAGFLRSAAILARPILKKEASSTAEVTQALTRAIIGTGGLSGLGFFLLDKGILTGAASKDKDVRDLQRSAGQGQYQVNLSALFRLVKGGFDPSNAKIQEDDFLYTYDWLQPASMAVSVGANTAKNIGEGKQKLSGLAGTAYNSVEGGLGTLTEQSVLSGLKNAAQGYPGQTVTDKIMDILSSIPSSFVPTYLNQAKQLMNNNKKETYSPNKLEQAINIAKAKIPGVEKDLPQQYDTLGEPKKTYQNNSVLNVLFNPGFSSRYQLSPEAKMIVDLINETGDETLAPRVPGKTIKIDKQSVKLNGDQFSRLQQLQGQETKERIGRISPDLPGKTKVNQVGDALKVASEKANKSLKKEINRLR